MLRKSFAPLLVLAACATSPTGRTQLLLVPEGQMRELGVQAFQEIKSQTPIENDPAWNAYVRCIADPITRSASGRLKVSDWEIVVFESDQANAFALPGGKIGVYTGITKVATTDAQLAAVVAHEVGHVIAEHGAERLSEGLVAQLGISALGSLAGDNPNKKVILGLLGVGTQVGVLLPHSRTQESEADVIGLDLMARAGFDPRQAAQLWRNMSAQAGRAGPPEFLSTHPSDERRLRNIEANLPRALARYEDARARGNRPACSAPAIAR